MLDRTVFAFHANANRCAVATDAETVEIWRLPEDPSRPAAREPESSIETDRSPIRGAAFVASGYLMTVHQLGECAIWDLPERRELPTAKEGEDHSDDEADGGPASPEPSRQGESNVPAKTDEQPPQRSDSESDSDDVPVAEEKWSRNLGVEAAVFRSRTRDGSTADRFAIGGRDGSLIIGAIDPSKSGKPMFGLADAHDSDITSLAFAPRSERLATGGRDHRIAIWSTDPSNFQARSSEPSAGETSPDSAEKASESPSGGTGASEAEGSDDSDPSPKIEETLDAPSIPRRLELEGSEGWPISVRFSHDGSRLASTALDNSLYLWDPRAEEPLRAVIHRHDNWVPELAWSPDDTRLATGSWDTSIGLFRAEDLTPKFRFDLHTDFISGLVFLSDPPRLISASYDGRLGIWDWSSGELTDRIRAHAGWIEVLLRLDDSHVLTVSSEDVFRIWNADTGERVAELGDVSFEGFDLGRAVDFSDYVDVPKLSSDELGEEGDSRFGLDAVEELSGRASAAESTSDSAVGLLEDAIETSMRDKPTPELGEDSAGAGRELLESRVDKGDGGSGATSAPSDPSEGSKLPDPDEAGIPEPDEEDEIDEAFSEVNLDNLKQKREEPGTPGESEQTEVEKSVDQFGESIDERVDDASLDMPDDVNSGAREEDVNLEEPPGGDEPAEPTSEPDLQSSGALGDEASPQLGSPVEGDPAGRSAESPGGSTPSEPPRGTDGGDAPSETQGSTSPNPRERDDDVAGDTLTGSAPSALGPSSPSPDVGEQQARSDSEPASRRTDASSEPSAEPAEEVSSSSESSGRDETGSGEESTTSDDSEPSADDLKEKFRKLKQQESDDSSDSE